jgi:rhodanese-related sulfurtransferase
MTALGTLGFSNVRTMVGGSFGGWVEAGYPIAEPGLPPAPEVLEQAVLDPIAVKKVNAALASLPEGWGVLEPAALNEEIIDGAELALVDVRKVTELEEAGMIEGATLISLEQFVANKELWPALDADVVVYCAAGTRGNIAAMILRVYGYKDVRNLKGGFTAWADAGLPVVAYVN